VVDSTQIGSGIGIGRSKLNFLTIIEGDSRHQTSHNALLSFTASTYPLTFDIKKLCVSNLMVVVVIRVNFVLLVVVVLGFVMII